MEVNIIYRTQKTPMSISKFKATLIAFFDIQGNVMAESVPSGQTVNKQNYIDIWTKWCERVRRKRTRLWRNVWILHQDNAPANDEYFVKQI